MAVHEVFKTWQAHLKLGASILKTDLEDANVQLLTFPNF